MEELTAPWLCSFVSAWQTITDLIVIYDCLTTFFFCFLLQVWYTCRTLKRYSEVYSMLLPICTAVMVVKIMWKHCSRDLGCDLNYQCMLFQWVDSNLVTGILFLWCLATVFIGKATTSQVQNGYFSMLLCMYHMFLRLWWWYQDCLLVCDITYIYIYTGCK